MCEKKEKIVMMESPEAASIRTLTGWVDRDGRYWGNDERMARWSGATHRKCKNKPEEHPIHGTHSYCEECHKERRQDEFSKMERVDWNDEPLAIFDDDTYFFDIESIIDYCVDNSLLPSELQLVICDPIPIPEFDVENYFEEVIPDGGDYWSLPQDILDAADALNKAIQESPTISWTQGYKCVVISDDILTDELKAEIIEGKNEKGGDHA